MAQRPVFMAAVNGASLVRKVSIEFKWHPGLSTSQKQKSIRSLHESARSQVQPKKILEVSSKSETKLGQRLSAFALSFVLKNGMRTTVECAFQGSKVFQHGGPYTDLYGTDSITAKKDQRIKESGSLMAFSLEGDEWPLYPQTCFYDWIYINALIQNSDMANDVLRYDAFTDIEFNPAKSINCQAHSVALYVSMVRRGVLEDTLNDRPLFLSFFQKEQDVAVQHKLL